MKKTWLIVVGIIVAILFVVVAISSTYNGLVTMQESVNSEFANVDTQLQRRADLIPNLVNTVKGYTKYESDVYVNVTEARTNFLKAGTIAEKLAANQQITNSLNELLYMVRENYPTLSASPHFTQLMDELSGTENRIAIARLDYNSVVKEYNAKVKRFPTNMMANMFGFEPAVYFEADQADREVPNVNFD